jgi:hypothetical protein
MEELAACLFSGEARVALKAGSPWENPMALMLAI